MHVCIWDQERNIGAIPVSVVEHDGQPRIIYYPLFEACPIITISIMSRIPIRVTYMKVILIDILKIDELAKPF